jgi:endonuclease/exonuclease/phosphatase family metal-dependent hydrolase
VSLTCLEKRMAAAADLKARGTSFHLTYMHLDTWRTIFCGQIRDSSVRGSVMESCFFKFQK